MDHLTTSTAVSSYPSLVVSGYHTASDGGGGTFANAGNFGDNDCTFSVNATVAAGGVITVNIGASSYTAGITIGMTVTGDSNHAITLPATVQLLGTRSAPNQITLMASTVASSNDTVYFRCDNGGTVIRDGNGYYWVRTKPAHSVLEWGAHCDSMPSNTVTYVDGLAQVTPRATTIDALQSSPNQQQAIGTDFNCAASAPKTIAVNANDFLTSETADGTTAPVLGLNYAQAMEQGSSPGPTKFGNGAPLSGARSEDKRMR
ncbi:MAG: hypothetical protein ACREHV_13875 [Rhizomicrobium sp.]